MESHRLRKHFYSSNKHSWRSVTQGAQTGITVMMAVMIMMMMIVFIKNHLSSHLSLIASQEGKQDKDISIFFTKECTEL